MGRKTKSTFVVIGILVLVYMYPAIRLALHHSSLVPFNKSDGFDTEIQLGYLWYPINPDGYVARFFVAPSQFGENSRTYLKFPFIVPYTPKILSLRFNNRDSIIKLIEYKNSQKFSESRWGLVYRDLSESRYGYQYYIPDYGVLLKTNDKSFDFDKDIKSIEQSN